MEFIDRKEEKARLKRFLAMREGAFACLYGRRRCGKTRLLHECAKGRDNVFYHLADRSDRPAQIARFVKEVAARIPSFTAVAGNDWGSVLDLWMALSPKGSVLIFDEFPYLAERDEALPSILQRICDVLRQTGKKIVICGSSQRMMQGFVLKQSEPLYGRAREILNVRPLEFRWMKEAFGKWTPFDRLKAWGVWGGVPRYWEFMEHERDLWSAVGENVCSPLGVLRNEPQFLLLDDVGDVAQASSVLSFIGDGANKISELASRMGRPATDLSRPMQRLLELGLVIRDVPFGADERGKKSLYRIADPFLDFWYAFVHPNWSNPDFLGSSASRKAFDGEYRPFLGGVWERLVRDVIAYEGLPEFGRVSGDVRRWWGTGLDRKQMEIDVVAESADRKTLLVGEAKLALGKGEAERTLEELRLKAGMLPFAKEYKKVEYRLFVANNPPPGALGVAWAEGVTPDLPR